MVAKIDTGRRDRRRQVKMPSLILEMLSKTLQFSQILVNSLYEERPYAMLLRSRIDTPSS